MQDLKYQVVAYSKKGNKIELSEPTTRKEAERIFAEANQSAATYYGYQQESHIEKWAGPVRESSDERAAWDKLQAASIAVWKAYKGLLKGNYPALVAAERSAKSERELVRPLPKKREE